MDPQPRPTGRDACGTGCRRYREANTGLDARGDGAPIRPDVTRLGDSSALDRLQARPPQRCDLGRHRDRAGLHCMPQRHGARRIGICIARARRARGPGDREARPAGHPRRCRLLHCDRRRRQPARRPRLCGTRPPGARVVTALAPSSLELETPATRAQPGALRRLLRQPAALGALAFLILLAVVSIAAPLVAPYDPRAQDLARVLAGPSWHHLLGPDTLGRDVLSRILYGGRRSLLSVVEGVAVVLAVGVPLGLVAGYFGGWIDRILSRVAEVVLAIPGIILVLVVLAVVPNNEDVAMVAFGLLGTPVLLRVVRAATLRIREDLYVAAARVSGLPHRRIIIRHVLPRVIGPIVVQGSLFAAYALVFETGIAFLGLTADASTPTWGGMVGEASTVIQQQEWLLFPSGAVIAATILAFGLLGDALRDVIVAEQSATTTRPRSATSPDHALSPSRVAVARSRALLEVRDLAVAHLDGNSETFVVDGVSFDVQPGET